MPVNYALVMGAVMAFYEVIMKIQVKHSRFQWEIVVNLYPQ